MSRHGAEMPMIEVIGSSGWEPGHLTGRDGELQLIGELVAGISAGRSAILIIEGPRGSGKSRLLREARRLAKEQNITAKKRNFVSTVTGTHAVDLSIANEPGTEMGRVAPGAAGPELVTLDGLQSVSSAVISGLLSLQGLATYPTVYIIASRTTRSHIEETSPLAGRGDVKRIDLRPLARGAVRELAVGLLRADPGPTLSSLLDEGEGNPLLVAELVKGLCDEQAITTRNGVAQASTNRIPHRVSVVVHDWMGELSENTRHFVQRVASLRRSFTLGTAADMLGQPPSTLIPALDEALECALISPGDDCFVFRHHLVWRVLNEANPGSLMTPGAVGLPALEPWPGPAVPAPRTPTEGTFRGTAPPIVPALLLAPSGLPQQLPRGVLEDLHSEVASALEVGAGRDELSACRARARQIVSLFADDDGRARRQAQTILAANHGPADGNVIAATVLSNLEWQAGRLSEGVRWGRDAVGRVELMPRAWRPYPYLAQASKLTALGEFTEAESLIDTARDEAHGLPTGPAAAYVAMSYGRLLLNVGRIAEARREVEAAVSLAGRLAADTARRPALSLLARIALRSGDRSAAADLMWQCRSKLADDHVETPTAYHRWCEYLVAAMHLAPQRAVGLLTAEYHELLEDSLLLIEERAAAPWLVRMALAANDALLAANIADTAERLAAANPEHHAVTVTAVHARGVLEDDVESLRYAVDEHQDAWAALKAREDLGAALRSLGGNRGVGAPITMARRNEPEAVEDAAADAGSSQAPDDEPAGDSRPDSLTHLTHLTETESRIAHLVADGMTNRQVARSLARSSHTVNYHLRQIYRKLDVRSRVELAKHVHDTT